MSHHIRLLPLVAVTLAAAAAAQSPPPSTTGAASSAPASSYASPLQGYQPFNDEKVMPWKDANDTVGRIGGWREYARESEQGGATRPATAAPGNTAPGAAPAAPAGHGGHTNH